MGESSKCKWDAMYNYTQERKEEPEKERMDSRINRRRIRLVRTGIG